MKLRNVRRFLTVAVASVGMVAGLAVATPGDAAAADRYQGPTLKVKQGNFDAGKNVELTLTNPNKAAGLFNESTCSSLLLSGTSAVKAVIAFNAKDYFEIIKIMASSGNSVGPMVSNDLGSPGPNTKSNKHKVSDGVYIFLGTCGGIKSLTPGNVGVSMLPVIVPSGIGSIGPAMEFGSLAMESGAGSADLGSIFSLLGGS